MEREMQLNERSKFERLERIKEVVDRSGLQSDKRHEFRLTPDRLELDMDCLRQFQAIGDFCIGYFKTLDELYTKAKNSEFPGSINVFIREALDRSVTKGQRRQQENVPGLPLMFRTDCVIAQDSEGKRRVYVTEIEGERPIGLGFEQLANKMSKVIGREGVYQPVGGVEGLRMVLSAPLEVPSNEPLAVILGEDQLFYLEEQEFFAKEARENGLQIEVVREKDLEVDRREGVALPGYGTRTKFLVCLPVFNNKKSGKVIETTDLFYASLDGTLKFIQPPKKFFGTKAGMALLFVPFLQRFFIENGVDPRTIEENVPRSTLITGSCFETERLMLENGEHPDPPVMVKAVGMSAARGMALPTDTEGTEDLLRQAKQKPFEFMTQEFIDTQVLEFDIFDEKSGKFSREPQFMRLTAYFIRVLVGGSDKAILTEVEGTGINDPLVHGNFRCIFFPVAFKEDQK